MAKRGNLTLNARLQETVGKKNFETGIKPLALTHQLNHDP